jgi:hypothetical protein
MRNSVTWGRVVVAGLAVALAATASEARADGTEDMFERAYRYRKDGDDARALDLYRDAYAREPSARALALMGVTEQSLKEWVTAERHLISALEDTSNAWIRTNRVHLERALDDVRAHLGSVFIRGTDGAAVYVQGEPRGTLPLPSPVRVAHGEVSVQVTAPGRQPFLRTVRVEGTSTEIIDAVLEQVAPERVAQSELPGSGALRTPLGSDAAGMRERASWRTPVGVVLTGLGAIGAATGTYLLLTGGGCAGGEPAAGYTCNTITRRPEAAGWALLGSGIGVAAAGGIVLLSGRHIRVAWSPRPAQIITIAGDL